MGGKYLSFKKGFFWGEERDELPIKQMGFFNKRRGNNCLLKMGESTNKRVLSLSVKQARVIGGIADGLPIKVVDFANKARGNSFIKEKVKRLKPQALIKIILMRQIKQFLSSFFHTI